ncbi:MAG: hypothetical protein ACXAEE_08005 [Candidatus Thorarchaeota archaeon]
MVADQPRPVGAKVVTGVVLIIASLVVLTPILHSWMSNPGQTSSHSAVFVFRGENPLWHTGQLTLTYEDGHIETSDLFGTIEKYDDDGVYLGLHTYVRAGRDFMEPEICQIEYLCSGLNMIVGPISFMSNNPQILYEDAAGRIIELWTGS